MDYEHGLEVVKELARSTSWYEEVLLYEDRLRTYLRDERLYGPAPQTTQERLRVIDQLNRLCIHHLNASFNDFCRDIRPGYATPAAQLTRIIGDTLCLYAEADATFYQKLTIALSYWRQQGKIHWLEMHAGDHISVLQQTYLRQAKLILFLCSADFFADTPCQNAMLAALHEQSQRKVTLVPILVRACAWEESPCKHLPILPANKLPINQWTHLDAAYDAVRAGLIHLLSQAF